MEYQIMYKFKEFKNSLRESVSEPIHVNTDGELLKINMKQVNSDLAEVTKNTFVNSVMFVNAVRGTLERYGVILPPEVNMHQINLEAEYTYVIGNSGLYAYVVHNLDPEGSCEGYACVVGAEDLHNLKNLDAEEDDDDMDPRLHGPTEWMKYPKARRDDDSGETAEYA
jgi:hypothetical protein